MTRQERRAEVKAAAKEERGKLRIVDPATDNIVGGVDITDISHDQGGEMKVDETTWNKLWRTLDTDGTQRATATVVTMPETSPMSTAIGSEGDVAVGRGAAYAATTLHALGKTLPSVLVAFEIYNLVEVSETLAKKGNVEDGLKWADGLFGIVAASS